MLVRITSAINQLIKKYLTTADLLKYGSTSRLLRGFAIEELIRREAPKYEKSNLTTQEILLFIAALGGHVLCLAYFLDEGVTVDQESSVGCPFGWCWTALHIAAKQGYEEGVVFLLEHGANVKLKTCSGYRAIDLVKDKNGPIARILRENRILYNLRKKIRRNFENEERDSDIAPPNIVEEPQI